MRGIGVQGRVNERVRRKERVEGGSGVRREEAERPEGRTARFCRWLVVLWVLK